MATLSFLGATRQVTGSCYLIETDDSRILLECGMVQGERNHNNNRSDNSQFSFKPGSIDAVIVSHAHLDHSGLLPRLIREGYNGPIYVTATTADLLDVMLRDAAFIAQKDIEWENKWRARADRELLEPLYTDDDVEQTLSLFHTVEYEEKIDVTADCQLRMNDAGHILGSSIVELWMNEKGHSRKLVFSGDLGNQCSPLLQDPSIITRADTLLLESTYGDRDHRPLDKTLDAFKQALDQAADDGGNVYIPSFAVGRTQDILYRLGQLHRRGELQQRKVFLDSPMASSVSKLYVKHRELYNEEDSEFNDIIKNGWESWLPILDFTTSTDESIALNKITGGAIIIAGSGMCTGGRITHHLKHNLWHRRNHIVFVGFQARGTLGRAMVDGAKKVKIMGSDISVKAHIHTLGGFSAHAGQQQLLDWANNFKERPALYLVHGETDKMLALQKKFIENNQWYANIPSRGESITV